MSEAEKPKLSKKEKRLAALQLARAARVKKPRRRDALTDAAVKRLAQRAGAKRLFREAHAEIRASLMEFIGSISRDACLFADNSRRRTLLAADLVYALQRRGRPVYGARHGL